MNLQATSLSRSGIAFNGSLTQPQARFEGLRWRKASANPDTPAPEANARLSRPGRQKAKSWLKTVLCLGLLGGGGAVALKGCNDLATEAKRNAVGTVTNLWGTPAYYITPDRQVTSTLGVPLGSFSADGKAYSPHTRLFVGETNSQGVIYRGGFFPTPVARVEQDGTIRGYAFRNYIGRIEGNFSLREKGAIALLTLLKSDND
jgi:hypothetical protein